MSVSISALEDASYWWLQQIGQSHHGNPAFNIEMQPIVPRRIVVSVPKQVQDTAAECHTDQGELKLRGRETGLDWRARGGEEEGCYYGEL